MTNKNYRRGRAYEYKMIRQLVEGGLDRRDCHRSAGSHGVFDIIAFDQESRTIYAIQNKSGKSREKEISKLDLSKYGGEWSVMVRII